MKNRIINGFAGTMVLISIISFYTTGMYNWLLLGMFVAINLLQSAFTNWCLLSIILDKLNIKD